MRKFFIAAILLLSLSACVSLEQKEKGLSMIVVGIKVTEENSFYPRFGALQLERVTLRKDVEVFEMSKVDGEYYYFQNLPSGDYLLESGEFVLTKNPRQVVKIKFDGKYKAKVDKDQVVLLGEIGVHIIHKMGALPESKITDLTKPDSFSKFKTIFSTSNADSNWIQYLGK